MTKAELAGAAKVRPGEDLDWPKVTAYLKAELPGLDGELEVLQFPNGSANLTYLLRFGDRPLVLRRPPFGRLAPGAHDMAREYRVLSRLWRAFPPAPRALLLCEDHSVAGATFFVMEFRSGTVIWDEIPEPMRRHPDAARRVGFAVVGALAGLHQVDYADCGLADLGRPDGFVARQVRGWRNRWEAVAHGAAPVAQPLMREVADTLERTLPAPQRSAILHNDLKLDNCQFDPADPDRVHSAGIGWYQAFACWKTAVVLQQLHDRYLRGETSDERMATRGDRVAELAARARRLLGKPRKEGS